MLNLTNAEIISRMSQLADYKGKADSGTTTTLTHNKYNRDFSDDEFNNYYICFLNGDNKGTDRIVTDFVSNTGTFTFDTVLNSVSNKTVYALVEIGYDQYVEEAYIFISEILKNDGLNIDLFLDDSQIKELHLFKTLDLICQDKFNDATSEDMYYTKHIHYKNMFETTYRNLKADYDSNEDGYITEDEKLAGASSGFINR